jgi:hypothetical protein
MTLEGILWQKFRKAWEPDWCQRMDVRYTKGVPDVNLVFSLKNGLSVAGWAELKVVKIRADGALVWRNHKLTLEQAIWLNGYTESGGRCCVVGGESIVGKGWRFYVIRGNYRSIVSGEIPDSMVVVATDVMNETFKEGVVGL